MHRKQHATRDGNVHVVPSHASTSCSWTLKGQPIDILQLDLKGILNESIDIQQLDLKEATNILLVKWMLDAGGLSTVYNYYKCWWTFNSVQVLLYF